MFQINAKEEDLSIVEKIEEISNNEIDDDFVFSFKSDKSKNYLCGASIINDR